MGNHCYLLCLALFIYFFLKLNFGCWLFLFLRHDVSKRYNQASRYKNNIIDGCDSAVTVTGLISLIFYC